MEKMPGASFIQEKYPDTVDSKRPRQPVTERFEKIASNPSASARLEGLLLKSFVIDTANEKTLQKLANGLYESEQRIAIEQGRGAEIERINFNETEILDRYKEAILEKEAVQKRTLESWFSYLKETSDYPTWFKYYVVRSLRDMGQFSRDDINYTHRTDGTIAPFPELNSEALAFVQKAIEHQLAIDEYEPDVGDLSLTPEEETEVIASLQSPETIAKITQREYIDKGTEPTLEDIATIQKRLQNPDIVLNALKGAKRNKRKEFFTATKKTYTEKQNELFLEQIPLNDERLDELTEELLKRLSTKDFAKLYAFAQVECAGKLDRDSLAGEWVKYDQGSDYTRLEAGLKGKGTGWCTATGSAEDQLKSGAFYVFYTKNKAGIPTEPRIAIRMQGDTIGEIRGVNQRQELEPELIETAHDKYHELPGAEQYEKASSDMKQVTNIYNRCFRIDKETGQKTSLTSTLSNGDLRFLYELDTPIEGFGYDEDPRVAEVLSERNTKEDLALLMGCQADQISLIKKEALSGKIKYHHGGLDLSSLTSAEGLVLPESIKGSLYLGSLTSAEGLVLPESIGGYLYLKNS